MEKVKEFLLRNWTMPEKVLLLTDVLLAGVLVGWLTSPLKGGFFSNNLIHSNNEGDIWEDTEEWEEEEEEE